MMRLVRCTQTLLKTLGIHWTPRDDNSLHAANGMANSRTVSRSTSVIEQVCAALEAADLARRSLAAGTKEIGDVGSLQSLVDVRARDESLTKMLSAVLGPITTSSTLTLSNDAFTESAQHPHLTLEAVVQAATLRLARYQESKNQPQQQQRHELQILQLQQQLRHAESEAQQAQAHIQVLERRLNAIQTQPALLTSQSQLHSAQPSEASSSIIQGHLDASHHNAPFTLVDHNSSHSLGSSSIGHSLLGDSFAGSEHSRSSRHQLDHLSASENREILAHRAERIRQLYAKLEVTQRERDEQALQVQRLSHKLLLAEDKLQQAAATQHTVAQLREECSRLRMQMQQLIQQPSEQVRILHVEVEEVRSQLIASQKTCDNQLHTVRQLESHLREVQGRTRELEILNDQLNDNNSTLQSSVSEAHSQTEKLARKHATAAANLRAECRRSHELEQARKEWEQQRQQLENVITERSSEVQAVQSQIERLQSDLHQANIKLSKQSELFDLLSVDKAAVAESLETEKARVRELQKECTTLRTQNVQLEEMARAQLNRLDHLLEQRAENEEALRCVTEERDWLQSHVRVFPGPSNSQEYQQQLQQHVQVRLGFLFAFSPSSLSLSFSLLSFLLHIYMTEILF